MSISLVRNNSPCPAGLPNFSHVRKGNTNRRFKRRTRVNLASRRSHFWVSWKGDAGSREGLQSACPVQSRPPKSAGKRLLNQHCESQQEVFYCHLESHWEVTQVTSVGAGTPFLNIPQGLALDKSEGVVKDKLLLAVFRAPLFR